MATTTLGVFLKSLRLRIDRKADRLGSYRRLPSRRGRRASQEEIAEAVEVSRGWYGLLESGAAIRASTRLLARIAEALGLSEEERAELFRLAVPEVAVPSLQPATMQTLDALQLVRKVARGLWSATTETEMLTVLAEAIAAQFGDADLIGAITRVQPGVWGYPVVIGGEKWQGRLAEAEFRVNDGATPAQVDEAKLHGVFRGPGEVGSRRELHRGLSVQARIDGAFAAVGFDHADFLCAHIRSNAGFEANLFTNYVERREPFSELQRAVLGALSALASLALSSPLERRREE
jgi:transcriptional regulator with XRE-family HTH domain